MGVLEMNLLLRDALRALDEAPRVLVFAPEVAAEGFDDLGALVAQGGSRLRSTFRSISGTWSARPRTRHASRCPWRPRLRPPTPAS